MDSSRKYHNPSPEIKANFISKMFYCWIMPFLLYGYKHDLEVKDIYNATKPDESEPLGDKLEKLWLAEVKESKIKETKPSLKKVIFKAFYKTYIVYGFLFLLQSLILASAQPTVLSKYIRYFSTDQETYELGPITFDKKAAGWLLGTGVVLLSFSSLWLYHFASLFSKRIGMRVRVASCSLLYRKLLRLSQTSLQETTTGQLVNLLSNDVQRFDMAAAFIHFLWIMPIQFVVASIIMYKSVGLATIAGMTTVTCQAVLIQGYLSKLQGTLRSQIAPKTDYRVKLMNEIVAGIRVIKMYAWEKPFEKVVEIARKLEINYISKASYIRGFSLALLVFTERFILYLILLCTVLLGNRLTSDVVFSMAQLVNTVQLYMCAFFPLGLTSYAEVSVTIQRLEKILLLEENQSYSKSVNEVYKIVSGGNGSVKIENATASWLPNPVVNTLIDINLTISPGTLCCIVGNVGAGKSSLLQMLLKELPIKKGKVQTGGRISYASQEPWLFVSSVRNNVLFGKPFSKNKYDEVVDVCALQTDFEQFPYNDKTLVGERGVSLSGGQRARINLARAVYTDAEIYILDDPLSAVDTHVGKHLFDKCIKNYLKDKTRILVTHQMQYLKDADLIVVLNNGKIESAGSYEELNKSILDVIEETIKDKKEEQKESSKDNVEDNISTEKTVIRETDEPEETQELIEKGNLSSSIYWEYYRTGASVFKLIVLVLIFILAQMASNACDLWVRHWTNMEEIRYSEVLRESQRYTPITINTTLPTISNYTIQDNNISDIPLIGHLTTESAILNFTNTLTESINTTFTKTTSKSLPKENYIDLQIFYIIIYSIFIIFCITTVASRSLLFYKICMTACRGLHNKMFNHILKAPMRFFDTNSSGRILSRFSKDIGCVDEMLPPVTLEATQIFLVMIGVIFMVFIITPWMIFPTAFLVGLFYYFRRVYLSSAQDVKRIEGVTRAPVFSHVTASLDGLSTIRSANAQQIVVKEFDILQDQHTGSWFLFIACSEAFGFYLDVISNIFLAFVTLQFLVFKNSYGMSGDVGLAISSSLILSGMLQLGVRQTTEVTSQMISVERILQYTKLDKEEDLNPSAINVPDRNWPSTGSINFQNVYLKYTPDQSPVLKNLNISIKAGEKVGIVGRTGAGKSTLISSLFRLAPIEGLISIDDIDTSTVQLQHLRSSISIIPQEPVLFSASVRYNLDPFGNVTDDILWKALNDVELKTVIVDLEQTVSDGGSNFSVGQRQLICLARAIVRNNKILVMDEATANVDPQTDSLIQNTIRQNFKECTVLTIAHRLNTIMDSNKVLVMNFGEMVEFGTPYELLQIQGGYFAEMVEQTGTTMAEHLKSIAKEAYDNNIQE